MLRRIERRPLSGGGEFRSGKTPYESLTVNLKISQGMATVEDVRMEGPMVRIALGGSASIPARHLDLKGTASLLSNLAGGAECRRAVLRAAVHGGGAVGRPDHVPDVQSRIQRSGAAQPLLDKLRERPPGDPIRSAIERLTGVAPPGEPAAEVAAARRRRWTDAPAPAPTADAAAARPPR